MSKTGQACDSPPATVFRIAGVAAGNNHFEPGAGPVNTRLKFASRIDCGRCQDKGRSQPGSTPQYLSSCYSHW